VRLARVRKARRKTKSKSVLRAVIGLGNPGSRYLSTRHNIGFRVVEQLALDARGEWQRERESDSEVAVGELGGQVVLLAKPQTFMNRSGAAVLALSRQRNLSAEEMLVVLDDFELEFGRLRFRRGGSDGGHRGLASVIQQMGTREIPRLRLGIGPPPPGVDVIDYVLSPFVSGEEVDRLVVRGAEAIEFFLHEGIDVAMNRFNGSGGVL
jgi:peptidyl-tRNA hydrolase, PTH1 family